MSMGPSNSTFFPFADMSRLSEPTEVEARYLSPQHRRSINNAIKCLRRQLCPPLCFRIGMERISCCITWIAGWGLTYRRRLQPRGHKSPRLGLIRPKICTGPLWAVTLINTPTRWAMANIAVLSLLTWNIVSKNVSRTRLVWPEPWQLHITASF